MKVIFLDYDGVVNTLWFNDVNGEPRFDFPNDIRVNNTQAIAWLNKLCRETGAKIVVSSTWRLYDNYKECLYNAGLNKDIEILGRTKNLGTARGIEIQDWLDEHQELNIEKFVILDDESFDFIELGLENRFVKTSFTDGLLPEHVEKAVSILNGR